MTLIVNIRGKNRYTLATFLILLWVACLVSLYRLSQRRLPALIAMIAVLLLFIAPDVSKTLEHQRMSAPVGFVSPPLMAIHDMPMGVMSHDGMTTLHAHPSSAKEGLPDGIHSSSTMPVDGGMMDDFACGYCQLLVHLPLLLYLFIPLIWLLFRLASQTPATRYTPWFASAFFPGLSQPRAPPDCPSAL
ncbi:DUF2946 domain-containing protein [Erwinia persicina]|uniref:DUF2946 domain-containing protein n=1 Tax=Erwinia persicina TaxID=55211 RepID=UPI00313EC2A2